MEHLVLTCLHSCREFVLRQKELVPALAKTIGIQPEEVFYSWALRKINQIGTIHNTNWRYFFHGPGCSIENIDDRRFLEVSFGPGGRFDTITHYSVLQFIMTSTEPWQEFPELRTYLATEGPPYDRYSGSHERISTLWERMQESGFIAIADPQFVALVKQYTTLLPNGQHVISLPGNLDERIIFDTCVSDCWIITELE